MCMSAIAVQISGTKDTLNLVYEGFEKRRLLRGVVDARHIQKSLLVSGVVAQ